MNRSAYILLMISIFAASFGLSGQTTSIDQLEENNLICQLLKNFEEKGEHIKEMGKSANQAFAGIYFSQIEKGERNNATIFQVQGSSNFLKLMQKGNDNRICNDSFYSDCLNSSKWGISQAGNENFGEIDQLGTLQQANFSQYGDVNEITIEQYSSPIGQQEIGVTNFASIHQIGYENKATIIQIYP